MSPLVVYISEGVQGGSETSNVVRVGEGGIDERSGGGDGSGRVEDVAIFVGVTRMDNIRN